jgi:hypothetical protein
MVITLIVLGVFVLARLPLLGLSLQRLAKMSAGAQQSRVSRREVALPDETQPDDVCVVPPLGRDGE